MVTRRTQASRPCDVVLYGATGFVGRQTAAYFAEHAAGLRWAIACRSKRKLDDLAAGLGLKSVGIVVALAAAGMTIEPLT